MPHRKAKGRADPAPFVKPELSGKLEGADPQDLIMSDDIVHSEYATARRSPAQACADRVDARPIDSSRLMAIFDQDALLTQLELIYGRPYQFGGEVDLGLPQPSLSSEEELRFDKLRWLADHPLGHQRHLLFGTAEIRDRLAGARKACPSFAVVVDIIDRAVALSMMSGTPLSVPPILLLGPPGCGKTHASKAIATALGTAIQSFSCATNSDMQQLVVGHPTSWRGARMSVVSEALVMGATAQPALLLDEIDKIQTHRDEQPYHVLLTLLEPENSQALQDEYLRVPFDLSRIITIATANDAQALPPYILDRLLVVTVEPPCGEDLLAIARIIVQKALNEVHDAIVMPNDEALARLARAHPRKIGRVVRLALGYAAAAGREEISLGDIDKAEHLAIGARQPRLFGFVGSSG